MQIFRIGAFIVGGLILLALLAVSLAWALGGLAINQRFAAPETGLTHSADAEIVARGAHLATITGCTGCHGDGMHGRIFVELPDGTRLVAPNVPMLAQAYSDEDLARVIRYGVRPNGVSVLGMPSEAFFGMTDEDLIAILSLIRATPVEQNDLPQNRFGVLVRGMLAAGEYKSAAKLIGEMTTRPTFDFASRLDRGAYTARIACAECHGLDLKGQPLGEFATPDLVVGAAYSPEDFSRLMETGVGVGDRDLGLMSEVAKGRFAHFTQAEIADLQAYLIHRADTLK